MLARLDLFDGGGYDDDNYPGLLDLLTAALFQLPESSQHVVRSLARQREDGSLDDDNNGHIVEDVLRTNGLGVSVGGISHTGLYPQIAVR